jgi:CDP-diacylglycerol---serine O-phosphatidyltransferase
VMVEPEARRRAVPHKLRRGAYLLPSLFTIGNILLGFYAIVLGLRSAGLIPPDPRFAEPHTGFAVAALLVFCAGILDGLDGRLARLIGTESEFGKEYDSLADVFTFGVAPALLTYLWGLHEWGRVGWLVPFFYLVCTATRLARFNVQTRVVDARYFVGLPTPAAAGTVCSILFFAPDSGWWLPWRHSELRTWMQALVLVALLLIGTLMVSTFRYRSFKQFDLRRRWSYRAFVPIAAIVLVVAFRPRAFFLAIAMAYTLSSPLAHFWGRLRQRTARHGAPPEGTEAVPVPPPMPPDDYPTAPRGGPPPPDDYPTGPRGGPAPPVPPAGPSPRRPSRGGPREL